MSLDHFLPVSRADLKKRGWDELDVIIVTGDAYVDHPSFGAAMIGRVLEAEGLRVGIIAQPDWRTRSDFTRLGKPRLFFGVTSGNIDSMLNHYTANRRLRHDDAYSPGDRHGLRPNRAVIVYANRIKQIYGPIPIVLGGIEAGLRRLAHYDFWDDEVRRSVLVDSRADMIVYGMGEKPVIELAKRMQAKEPINGIENIRGTVVVSSCIDNIPDCIRLPSYEEVKTSNAAFNDAVKIILAELDPAHGKPIAQMHGNRYVIQLPPAKPLSTAEMDRCYELPFNRRWHPVYDGLGGVPALETVKFSITSHRGCYGDCSFCSLALHMGKQIQSRSIESIVREVKTLCKDNNFKGIISDIGGPTSNMYMSRCSRWNEKGICKERNCIMPKKCPRLKLGHGEILKLWDEILKIPKVRKVFVSTGVRYDLLGDADAETYLEELCRNHVSGQLKIAPEHVDEDVLAVMNKPPFEIYDAFCRKYETMNKKLNKKQYLVPYFISSHPGSTLKSMLNLAFHIKKLGYFPEQIQDFIPMPMTLATAMYHTGRDPITGKRVYCAKSPKEKKMQRALIHFKNRRNRKLVAEALKILKREDLIKVLR
ncbi:MAG: YgiQ family radical SAM protein [Pseudomonadota bacterium]